MPRITVFALVLLLPIPAMSALTPEGAPFAIVDEEALCSCLTDVEVVATPEGAFEVVWADEGGTYEVRSRLFAPGLEPAGPPVALLPLHGGQSWFDFAGTWAD